jgi:TRAP-type C4-dicarboxylate transport system permease small subunit
MLRAAMDFLEDLGKCFDSLLKYLRLVTCLILVFITVSVCIEVVLRYFFNKPQVWVIELSEYGLLYITFLAAGWVLQAKGHITIELVTERLGERARAFLLIVRSFLISGVSMVLIWYGLRVTWTYFSRGTYNPTILEIPTAAILVVIPFGGLFLLIQSLREVISNVLEFENLKSNTVRRVANPKEES